MFLEKLNRLRQNNLLRHIKDRSALSVSSHITRHLSPIFINGAECLNFSSNDYLGLASNELMADVAKKAMDNYGFGSGASRLLSGGTELHFKLEKMMAKFKGTEGALIFNSGYTANISAIPAVAKGGDVIFSDELNHASVIDGCRLSKAKKIVYRHKDINHLVELMKKESGNRKIVITDSVFSMDGDIAPLKEIYDACLQYSAMLYIDDAHGTGVLGKGEGALSHFKIKPASWIIQMGTFSKALGSYGAFIAASKDVVDWLTNTARGFIYSTALPACIIAASITALQILQKEPLLIKKLWQSRERLFKGIQDLGYDTANSATPIIPIIISSLPRKIDNVKATLKLAEHLLKSRIYAPAIRPPTVKTPRIRVTVTASHTEEDVDRLLDFLRVY